MKKILAVTSCIMLILLSIVQAMELMENDDMLGDIDAQAGVGITNTSGGLYISTVLQSLSWGDDDGYTGAVGTGSGAGHIKYMALLTSCTTIGSLTVLVSQTQGNTIMYDVDSTGVFARLGSVNITVTPPSVIRISNGTTSVGTNTIATGTAVYGDLAVGGLAYTITTPTVMRISPH